MSLSQALHAKNNQIEIISRFFDPKTIEQIARDTKFVQRNSPLSGMDFFLLCVFAHQKMDCISLEDMCAELLKGGIDITKQSLQDRFNEHAVEFITALLNRALSIKLNIGRTSASQFSRITIWDSTQIELPEAFCVKYRGHGGGASKSALKLQYGYDLVTQKIIVLLVQQAVQPDCSQPLEDLQRNDLRIEDLGYFNLKRFEQIGQCDAFFLSRYKFGVCLFEQTKTGIYTPVDLIRLDQSMQPDQRKTQHVFIGLEEKLPVRIIIEKVPQQIADQKRRKLKYDKHNKRKTLSKKRLKLCNLNIYITNTTEQQLPAEQIRLYYSLRWQIEIMFKSWKSIYKIDRTKPMKLHRFECMHWGALILIVITTNLMAICRWRLLIYYGKQLSEFRFFKLMKSALELFRQAVARPDRELHAFFILMETMAMRYAVKQAKKSKPTPYNILNVET